MNHPVRWHDGGNGVHWADIAGHRLTVSEHGSGPVTEFCRWGVLWRNRFVAFGYYVPSIDDGKRQSEMAARQHLAQVSA
jgi:hypothetical protein